MDLTGLLDLKGLEECKREKTPSGRRSRGTEKIIEKKNGTEDFQWIFFSPSFGEIVVHLLPTPEPTSGLHPK